MSDTVIRIRVGSHFEEVAGTRVSDDLVLADEHPEWGPFSPCDVVRVQEDEYVGVAVWASTYTAVAHLGDDIDDDTVDLVLHQWNVSSYCTRAGDAEIIVTTFDLHWMHENVQHHPLVRWVTMLRRPVDETLEVDG